MKKKRALEQYLHQTFYCNSTKNKNWKIFIAKTVVVRVCWNRIQFSLGRARERVDGCYGVTILLLLLLLFWFLGWFLPGTVHRYNNLLSFFKYLFGWRRFLCDLNCFRLYSGWLIWHIMECSGFCNIVVLLTSVVELYISECFEEDCLLENI